MKVLVTGSSGLVGSASVKIFLKNGWEVVGIDNNMRSELFGTEKRDVSLNIDIRDENSINLLFSQNVFDAIIHTAAQPSHDWAKTNPLKDFDINARGTLILLEATRKYCPNAVFVHVSTDKVYGQNMHRALRETKKRVHSYVPFGENIPTDFAGKRSLFGCSKLSGDIYAQEYANYFGMKVGIFRPGCITGKDHAGAEYHGFLAYLAHCIKNEKLYRIFGFGGKQVRDQIHADDLASAFFHFVLRPTTGAVYNIGGGPERSVSVLEAIEMIEAETGKKAVYEFAEERPGDRIWDVHDVRKFKSHYPEWDYTYSLKDIIKDLCL